MWFVQPANAQTSLHIQQSDQSLGYLPEYSMTLRLLTEHHLEFLSLKGSYTGSFESFNVKMPHCWKSHVTAKLCGVSATAPAESVYFSATISMFISVSCNLCP